MKARSRVLKLDGDQANLFMRVLRRSMANHYNREESNLRVDEKMRQLDKLGVFNRGGNDERKNKKSE